MPRSTVFPSIPRRTWPAGLGEPLCLLTALVLFGAGSVACSGTADPLAPGGAGSAGTAGSAGSVVGGAGGQGTAGSLALAGSAGAGSGFVAGGGGAPGTGGAGAGGASSGGGAGGGGGAGASGGAPVEASFSTLKAIIPLSCFGGVCHDLPEHPLHLTVDANLYTTLTTHVTKNCGVVVKPGSPQDSALVKLLKGPCGGTDRMPYGKCVEDGDEGCVSPENIAAIEQWIANGAPP